MDGQGFLPVSSKAHSSSATPSHTDSWALPSLLHLLAPAQACLRTLPQDIYSVDSVICLPVCSWLRPKH